jgi:hypothetical protein
MHCATNGHVSSSTLLQVSWHFCIAAKQGTRQLQQQIEQLPNSTQAQLSSLRSSAKADQEGV